MGTAPIARIRFFSALHPVAVALVAAAGVSLIATRADADVHPRPRDVETCTLEREQHNGDECLVCRALFGYPEHCPGSLKPYGFTPRCHTRGGASWSEIWCRPRSPTAKVVPPEALDQLADPRSPPPAAAPSSQAPSVPLPAASAEVVAQRPQPVPPPPGSCGACSMANSAARVVLPTLAMAAVIVALQARRRGRAVGPEDLRGR